MLDTIAVMHLQLSMKPMWICAIWKLFVSSTLATLSLCGRTCSVFNFVILLYVTICRTVLSCHASKCDSWGILNHWTPKQMSDSSEKQKKIKGWVRLTCALLITVF